MASTTNFQLSTDSLLVAGIAGQSGGLIQNDDSYRRYRSGLGIGVYERGTYTYARRSIFYEVGRRSGRLSEALSYQKDLDDCVNIDASIPINPAMAANFEGWARKYSNFSPQWDMMDLSGVVERLSKAIAAQSVYGNTSTTNIRGGQPVRVVALGTLDSPQTASTRSVFVPRTVDTVSSDHVFAVIAAAVNGEGSVVTTDVVRLDAGTNEPVVPAVTGYAMATAAVEALRVLGANMEASGGGDLFALAVTRGIHSVVSVVSHTDEGGWMRKVLRGSTYRAPYGGINTALREYPSLPPLATSSAGAVSSWVDSIALKTAALVAHCDPCVAATGGMYPTVFTANSGTIGPAGVEEGETTALDSRNIGRQINADFGRFAPLYTGALTGLFGLTSVSGVASAFMATAAGQVLYDSDDRHLQHKTVAPYFWVEPTSLIPHNYLGSEAERSGFAALTTPGVETDIPAFERVKELDRGRNANFSTIMFKMRSARTSGLVAAYAANPANLAGLKLYQFDEDAVVLAGDQGPTAGDVPTKHGNADGLASYLWTRGQSAIPAPAEFINTQSMYAAKYKLVDWDDDFDATLTDLPEAWELEQNPTKWRVSVPTALANGPSNWADSNARRARSRAAIGLAQASIRLRGLGDANSPTIIVSNVPPAFDDGPRAPMAEESTRHHNVEPGSTQLFAEGSAAVGGGLERVAPALPVVHQQPLRGAPYARQGGGAIGAGGLPPNPRAGPGGMGGGGGGPSSDHPSMTPTEIAAALAAGPDEPNLNDAVLAADAVVAPQV